MATTTTNGSNVESGPYSESDKLGPLGNHTASALGDPSKLRSALLAEFTAAADTARDAATRVDAGAATAVHEYRKALRRARAVLSMIGDALPKSERRAVKAALQDARRAVSTARDQTVAPDALAQLALGEAERATANAVLANAAEAMPPIAEIKQLLSDGAARAASQGEALQAALPQTIEWRDVADNVSAIYRAARDARDNARTSRGAFHTWRRRSKELGYQLDWIAGHAGKRIAELQTAHAVSADALSGAVDLIMLREFVDTHAQGIAPDAIAHLTTAIDAQLDDLMKAGRKAGKHAFDDSARSFAKHLRRAATKDLRPAAEPHVDAASDSAAHAGSVS